MVLKSMNLKVICKFNSHISRTIFYFLSLIYNFLFIKFTRLFEIDSLAIQQTAKFFLFLLLRHYSRLSGKKITLIISRTHSHIYTHTYIQIARNTTCEFSHEIPLYYDKLIAIFSKIFHP